MPQSQAVFLLSAPDQPGLVARFSGFFFELGLNILDASNHSDASPEEHEPRRFFMRLVVDLDCPRRPRGRLARLGGLGLASGAWSQAFGDLASVQARRLLVRRLQR
jgi:formyltetrahydrofolate deformylase